MSHLIEEYAKNLGVKIAEPIVSQHFWPVIPEKYIVVYLESESPSKQYKYYDIVFDTLYPYLQRKNIKVVQIGSSASQKLDAADEIVFDLDFKKFAYIISRSVLYVGTDSVFSHYASSQQIPLVTLFGNTYAKTSDGYWSSDKNKINLEPRWEIKPCMNPLDPHDNINKIKPETIAQAILNQLKIEEKTPLVTRFIGEFFHTKVYELVPDFFQPTEPMKQKHWFMRLDFIEDACYVENWCDFLSSFSFFTKKIIQPEFIVKYKNKIENINFIIDRDTVISDGYLNVLYGANVKVCLLVEKQEDVPFLRNKFFDHVVQPYQKSDKSLLKDCEVQFGESFLSSSKTLISQGKKYPSIYHWRAGKNCLDKNFKIEDNSDLLEELNHFYIYDIGKNL